MEMAREQAQQWLHEVDAVTKELRNRLAYGITGPILTLWGIVWIVCFAITHFAPKSAGWGWLVGNVLGIAGSLYLGAFRGRRAAVRSDSSKRLGRRLLGSWISLFVYATIWLAVLWPWREDQLGTFLVMLVMFAYVVMGLWLEIRFLLWLGLVVTLLAGAGYAFSWVIPGYLDLWLGFTGGTALLGSGLYMTLRWR
jgi:hypothetical protein